MTQTCPVCGNPVDPQQGACDYCGFKLLGSTQRFQPIALGTSELPVVGKREIECTLHVMRGPQTGATAIIGDKPVTIGRSPQCDVFLNDMTVSREHAVVERKDGSTTITDTNSFNGVWVNNQSVDQQRLINGDVIQIGTFCMVYKEEEK